MKITAESGDSAAAVRLILLAGAATGHSRWHPSSSGVGGIQRGSWRSVPEPAANRLYQRLYRLKNFRHLWGKSVPTFKSSNLDLSICGQACLNQSLFGAFFANETLYQLSYTPQIFEKPPLNVQNLVCSSTGGPPVLPP